MLVEYGESHLVIETDNLSYDFKFVSLGKEGGGAGGGTFSAEFFCRECLSLYMSHVCGVHDDATHMGAGAEHR